MIDFKEVSKKCPWVCTAFIVRECAIDHKICNEENCAVFFWLGKLAEEIENRQTT